MEFRGSQEVQTVSAAAQWEPGGESRKGKLLCNVVKFWYRMLPIEKENYSNAAMSVRQEIHNVKAG
jgi:hypothetical protein